MSRPARLAALLLAAMLLGADAPADRAYWLVGNWHCESRAGSKAARTYSKVVNDGSINMTNTVRLPSLFYVVMRERYQYDPATDSWAVDSPPSALWGPMHATAGQWLRDEWVFQGKGAPLQTINSGHIAPEQVMRMVYTFIDDDTFRRAHQVKQDDRWTSYSQETCTRDLPANRS